MLGPADFRGPQVKNHCPEKPDCVLDILCAVTSCIQVTVYVDRIPVTSVLTNLFQ